MKSLLSFFLLLFIALTIKANRPDHVIKLVFRFDDYLLVSNKFYDSLFYVFKNNNIPLCLGIIPFNKNGLVINELTREQFVDFNSRISRGEIEIALHGYNHVDNELHRFSKLVNTVESEFAGLEYNMQFKKIEKAKKTIDSLLNTSVKIFIPPYNTYNNITLHVLDSLKFEIISARLEGSSSSENIKYIPSTIDDINELPKMIRKYEDHDIIIVALMHPYTFMGGPHYSGGQSKKIYFEELDTLLNWINNQNDINSTTFSMLIKDEIFDNNRLVLNSISNNLVMKILNKLKLYRYGVYYTTEHQESYRAIFAVFNILLHIVLYLTFYIASKAITKMIKPSKTLMFTFISVIVLVVFVVLYSRINSDSLITIAILIITISTALFSGLIKGSTTLRRPRLLLNFLQY